MLFLLQKGFVFCLNSSANLSYGRFTYTQSLVCLQTRFCVCVYSFVALCANFHALASQDLDGPLRPQAEAIFEERKRQWLHSQHQEGVQKNTTKYSGNGEAEDKHKEMDRICDTEDDLIICSSEDEEFEEGPIGETALEMNGTIPCNE